MTLATRIMSRSGRHTLAGDAQAAEIVRHACDVMLAHGAGGFSVRKVAQQADVSIGHLQHYFPTRLDLLRGMLVSLEGEFYQHFREHIAPLDDPRARVAASARYLLAADGSTRTLALLREFWALGARDELVGAWLDAFYRGLRRFAAGLLRAADPTLDARSARLAGQGVVALLSGAFLYLGPRTPEAEAAAFRDRLVAQVVTLAKPPRNGG